VVFIRQNSTPPVTCAPSQAVAAAPKLCPVTVTVAPLVVIDEGLSSDTAGGGFATTVEAPAVLPVPLTGSIRVRSSARPEQCRPRRARRCSAAARPFRCRWAQRSHGAVVDHRQVPQRHLLGRGLPGGGEQRRGDERLGRALAERLGGGQREL